MARKLKTYTTSAGFFDLAVAAPSMKAALEAWGATSNLFHQGFAKVSDDPKIVAATMARPGVILRRPVGSSGAFTEHAALPDVEDISEGLRAPAKRAPATPRPKADEPPPPRPPSPPRPDEKKAQRKASLAFEREQKRREQQARRDEAAREKERARRDRAIAAAEAALAEARRAHEESLAEIDRARAALDRKLDAEEARWKKQRERLESAVRAARSPTHLRLV